VKEDENWSLTGFLLVGRSEVAGAKGDRRVNEILHSGRRIEKGPRRDTVDRTAHLPGIVCTGNPQDKKGGDVVART